MSESFLKKLLELDKDLNNLSLTKFLDFIRGRYELTSVAYLCPTLPGYTFKCPYTVRTASEAWPDANSDKLHEFNQSILEILAGRSAPTNLAQLRLECTADQSLGVLRDFTFAHRNGALIPVHGPGRQIYALFIVASDDSDFVWTARKHALMNELLSIAVFMHQRVFGLFQEKPSKPCDLITAREVEALQWMREGRELNDIVLLMGIARETVVAYLESARFKLQAINYVHAVGKAIADGILS